MTDNLDNAVKSARNAATMKCESFSVVIYHDDETGELCVMPTREAKRRSDMMRIIQTCSPMN